MNNQFIIVWDLGATKCAVALMQYVEALGEFELYKKCVLAIREYPSLEALVHQIQTELNYNFADAKAICIGAAGCFNGEELCLIEGYPYPMPFLQLAQKYHWPSFSIVHDYLPVACATYTRYMQDPVNTHYLNNATLPLYGRRVTVGIGTGLGMKDVMLHPSQQLAFGANEIGHIGIPVPPHISHDQLLRHQALVEFLHSQNHVMTFEKILSGQGTVRLHQFLYPCISVGSPEEVGDRMRQGCAPELLAIFAWYVGLLVGTIQLAFMPEGGIWLTGGVLLKHVEALALAEFWDGIRATPAYLETREKFPLGVLLNTDHALYGGAFFMGQNRV